MKKIINGKAYNTATAKLLGFYSNGLGNNDFEYIYEELYQKSNGEYFLFGTGGARSKYAIRDGNGFCGGNDIVPLTEMSARKWVQDYLSADEYCRIF